MLVRPPETNTDGRFRLTLEMFEALSDGGFISHQHVELLDGELYARGFSSPAHSYAVQEFSSQLHRKFAYRAVVRVRLPIILQTPPADFLEPDLALLKLPAERYRQNQPTNNDAVLVIEAADTTLEHDRTRKLAAYARNAISEYWILNVAANELEVYREPDGKNYLSKRILKPGQPVSPLEFPDGMLEWWL